MVALMLSSILCPRLRREHCARMSLRTLASSYALSKAGLRLMRSSLVAVYKQFSSADCEPSRTLGYHSDIVRRKPSTIPGAGAGGNKADTVICFDD